MPQAGRRVYCLYVDGKRVKAFSNRLKLHNLEYKGFILPSYTTITRRSDEAYKNAENNKHFHFYLTAKNLLKEKITVRVEVAEVE